MKFPIFLQLMLQRCSYYRNPAAFILVSPLFCRAANRRNSQSLSIYYAGVSNVKQYII